jgi:hypothetical protein
VNPQCNLAVPALPSNLLIQKHWPSTASLWTPRVSDEQQAIRHDYCCCWLLNQPVSAQKLLTHRAPPHLCGAKQLDGLGCRHHGVPNGLKKLLSLTCRTHSPEWDVVGTSVTLGPTQTCFRLRSPYRPGQTRKASSTRTRHGKSKIEKKKKKALKLEIAVELAEPPPLARPPPSTVNPRRKCPT